MPWQPGLRVSAFQEKSRMLQVMLHDIAGIQKIICYKFDSHFGMISVVGSGFLLSSGSHFLSIWWYILPHSGPDFCRLLQAAPTRHAGCKTYDIILGQPQQRIPNRWPTTLWFHVLPSKEISLLSLLALGSLQPSLSVLLDSTSLTHAYAHISQVFRQPSLFLPGRAGRENWAIATGHAPGLTLVVRFWVWNWFYGHFFDISGWLMWLGTVDPGLLAGIDANQRRAPDGSTCFKSLSFAPWMFSLPSGELT